MLATAPSLVTARSRSLYFKTIASQTSGSDECQMSCDGGSVAAVHTVFVGNLGPLVSERPLHDAFSVCGPISGLQVRLRF